MLFAPQNHLAKWPRVQADMRKARPPYCIALVKGSLGVHQGTAGVLTHGQMGPTLKNVEVLEESSAAVSNPFPGAPGVSKNLSDVDLDGAKFKL